MNNPHDSAKPSEPMPRIGPGPDGRAVHLNTVAKWLAERDDLAPDDAYGRLLDTLARLEPEAVHWLANGSQGYGQLLPIRDEWFASLDGAPGPAMGRRVLSAGIGRYTPPPAPATCLGPGAVGLVAWLRCRADLRPGLIVAESVARRLWGWGSGAGAVVVAAPLELAVVETWEQLVAWRLENTKGVRGPDWGLGAGKQLRILNAELQQRMDKGVGKSAALDAMGRELGYTGAEPRKPLQKAMAAIRMRKASNSAAPSLDGATLVRNGQKVPKPPKAA